jgi:hypothetical protein
MCQRNWHEAVAEKYETTYTFVFSQKGIVEVFKIYTRYLGAGIRLYVYRAELNYIVIGEHGVQWNRKVVLSYTLKHIQYVWSGAFTVTTYNKIFPGYQPRQMAKFRKKTNVSRTISVLVLRVLKYHLTRLVAREDFIIFSIFCWKFFTWSAFVNILVHWSD